MKIDYAFSSFDEFHIHIAELEEFLCLHAHLIKNYVIISVIEVINNVFEHSMRGDEQLFIKTSLSLLNNQLKIEITHNGAGFNCEEKLDQISDPDTYLQNHILSLRGRGLAIIKKCADELQYLENGRKVYLTFLLK